MTALLRAHLVAAGLLVTFVTGSGATVLLPADLPELVKGATAIAYGRIVAIETRPSAGRGAIERIVTLAVTQYFKGTLGAEVDVRVPGGSLGGYRTVMPGSPEFTRDEEVVLFLRAVDGRAPVLVGLWQGVVRVHRDERSGARFVVSPLQRPARATPVPVNRGDLRRVPVRLEAFADQVRTLVAGASLRPVRER